MRLQRHDDGAHSVYSLISLESGVVPEDWKTANVSLIFTCVSYAEARNSYRLDVRPSVRPSVCLSVCPSVRHTLAPYQNG